MRSPPFKAKFLQFTCSNLPTIQRWVLDRSGWVWSMPTILCTTLESHYCRIRHSITTRLTKTWACLSWPCTQTLPERVIRHHNQSAVLRWGSLTPATELIWRFKSVPRWRHRFILEECPFGMIIIPNWSKWSLMMRKVTQAELALASAWDCLLLSYQSLLTTPFFNHSQNRIAILTGISCNWNRVPWRQILFCSI